MRIVFFGTPVPAAVALDALLASRFAGGVATVVTQPDRPRGRSERPQPSPVKERASAAGIDVLQPESPRDPGFVARVAAVRPDVSVVVAYGHILPRDLLAVPRLGTVNVHYSLLPAYRGAAPVQRALMAGEEETGVTTFLLEPTVDTGPILIQAREEIRPDDSSGSLLERLAPLGARLLVETLEGLESGSLTPIEQDPGRASPAPKVRPEEGAIDWARPASEIANLVRALDPAPGAYTGFRGKRLKVWRARPQPGEAGAPGTVAGVGKDGLAVATGEGLLQLLEVQLEGAKRLKAAEFVRGRRPTEGETLRTL